jgi:hypothetical protein
MAKRTQQPKTYKTSEKILALASYEAYDLVMGSAGNASFTIVQEDGTDLEFTHTDLGLLIVGWDHEHNGYEIVASHTIGD